MSIVEKLVRLPALRDGAKVIGNEAVAPSLRGNRKSGDDVFDSCDAKLCAGSTNPAVLQARYGYPTLTNYTAGNGMACAEFQFQGVDDEDLSNFATSCGVVREIASSMTPPPPLKKKKKQPEFLSP